MDVLKAIETSCARNDASQKPLVCIESTLDPAMLNLIKIYNDKLEIVSFPHRLNPGDPEHHVFNLERVLGGVTEKGTERALTFYGQFMDKGLIYAASFEASALSKVLENAYRFWDIAFAESARMDCESQGILFEPVRRRANERRGLDIKEARDGIYKKCLPKDARLLCDFLKNDFLNLAVDLDERYKKWHHNEIKMKVMEPNGEEQVSLADDLIRIYKYIELAFSESLRMDFEQQCIDFEPARNAANTKWNIHIKKPGTWQEEGSLEPKMQAQKLKSRIFANNEFLEQARRSHQEYLEWCERGCSMLEHRV